MHTITIKTYEQDRPDVTVTTVEELDNELDRIAARCARHPMIIDLINADGDCLTIGLGAEQTAVTVTPASGGRSLESIGDETGDPEAHSVFFYGGLWTGVLKRQSVPIALARQEVRRWFQEGRVNGAIRWHSR